MSNIVLIRHAAPTIVHSRASNGWGLSEEGRKAAAALAPKLLRFNFAEIFSSPEPKALQTAQIIADLTGSPVLTDVRLREHERGAAKFVGKEVFEAQIARIFDMPDKIAYGDESADAVHARFSAAIQDALARHSGPVAAVTHGTAMTIYVSRLIGIAPMPFWTKLGMPTAIVVENGVVAEMVQ